MFGTMAGGLLVGPWQGAWDVAVQSPTATLVMLTSLLTVLVAGLVMMIYGGQRRRAFAAQSIRVSANRQPDSAPRRRGRKTGAA